MLEGRSRTKDLPVVALFIVGEGGLQTLCSSTEGNRTWDREYGLSACLAIRDYVVSSSLAWAI